MSDDTQPGAYEVGFGKPPSEHRFQKGTSGNPKGRPKKKRPSSDDYDPTREAARELLITEAYRIVSIREGDKQIEMPAIQAVFRALGVSAIKGNRLAARELSTMLGAVEADKHQKLRDYVQYMAKYRDSWIAEFKRCDGLGIPRPNPIPHPFDIEIDPLKGEVRVRGPRTEEEQDKLTELCYHRDETIRDNERLRRLAKRKDADPKFAEQIAANERALAQVDALLPDRLRYNRHWLSRRLEERREERMREERQQSEPSNPPNVIRLEGVRAKG